MNLSIKTVLVVDDTPSNLQMMDIMLSRHGLTVESALNGDEALEQLKTSIPDLIMLDIRMPGMDGFEFCEALRANPDYRDIEIILVTAVDSISMDPDRIAALNIRDVLPKPITGATLEQKLHQHYSA